MAVFEENLWLVAVFFSFIVFCIVAMILRNRAAKIDCVGRTKKDAVADSVSLDTKKNTNKID